MLVEQRGIDVVVRARRASDAEAVEFQEEVRRTGQEHVEIVADKGGVYTLAIATSRGIYSGTYVVRMAAVEPQPTPTGRCTKHGDSAPRRMV